MVAVTVKGALALAMDPGPTVTTKLPVVAPEGTGTTMLVSLQVVGEAKAPLNVTVLEPCAAPKLLPLIVTDVPMGPDEGFRLVIRGVTTKAD